MQLVRRIFWLGLIAITSPLFAGSADDQYQVAAHHYRNARWELAVEEFESFVQQFPNDARADGARFYMAEAMVQRHDLMRARQLYSEYLERQPDGKHAGQALFRRGELAYFEHDFSAAKADLQAFQKRDANGPLAVHALYYLGQITLADQQADAARHWFQACLARQPVGALGDNCRMGLAHALELLGDVDGAVRFYRFIADKQDCTARDEAQLQIGIIRYQQGEFRKARAELESLTQRIGTGPLAAHSWYWLGMCQLAGGDWAAATATLTDAANRYHDHALAPAMQFAAAEALRQAGQVSQAQDGYERLVATWPDSRWGDDALQVLVQIAWDESRWDDVGRLAQQFATNYPHSSLRRVVRQTAGRALLKQGDFTRAAELFHDLTSSFTESHEAGLPRPNEGNAGHAGQAAEDSPVNGLVVHADPAANWYYLALAELGAGNLDQVLDALAHVTDTTGPPALINGVRVARSAALVGLERYDEAIKPLESYLAAAPNGPDAGKCRAQLAVAYAQTDRWADAQRVVSAMANATPLDDMYFETVQFLAEAAYAQKRTTLAGDMFGRLTDERAPADYVARGFSGLAWLQWDKAPGSSAAAAAFEKLISRFPHHPLAAEAAMLRGSALQKLDKPEAALGMYHLVIDQFPDSEHAPAAALAAAKLCDELQQYQDAESVLRALRQTHPDYQPDGVLYQLAWVLVDQQKTDQADRIFQQIHDEMTTSPYWADATYRLAERAAREQQVKRADRLALKLLETAKNSPMAPYAIYLRGQLAGTEQRWQDVTQRMQQLLADYPQSPLAIPARYWLAEAQYRLQQFAAAQAGFDQLAEQVPAGTQPWLALVALRRAQVRAQLHQWDEAHAIATKIAAQYPNFDRLCEVDYVLGRYRASRAEFDDARAAYRRVIKSHNGAHTETAAMAQWMIGETYFMQKRFDQAIKEYYRVEGLYDFPRWQAAALLQAGKCHEMLGQWQPAMSVYTQIIETYSTTEVAVQATNRLRVARQRAEISARR